MDIDKCEEDRLNHGLSKCIMHGAYLGGKYMEKGFKILNPRKYVQQALYFSDLKYRCYVFIPTWDYKLVDLEGNLSWYKTNLKGKK